jgi:hypothetical protein
VRITYSAHGSGVVKLTCKLVVELQLRAVVMAVVDERRVRRAATVEAALALDHGPHGGPRATDAQVCAGLRPGSGSAGAVAAAPHQRPQGAHLRVGVWAVGAALVDAIGRGRRHLWRITHPRDVCCLLVMRRQRLSCGTLWHPLLGVAWCRAGGRLWWARPTPALERWTAGSL